MSRLEPGLVLGERYRLEARIASGGMADVWAAEDDVLQRRVALKVMRPDPDHEELSPFGSATRRCTPRR